jgi:hypothetical protein
MEEELREWTALVLQSLLDEGGVNRVAGSARGAGIWPAGVLLLRCRGGDRLEVEGDPDGRGPAVSEREKGGEHWRWWAAAG